MGGTVELILEFLFQSDLNSLYVHKYRHSSFLAINHGTLDVATGTFFKMALLNLCMKYENLFGQNHSLSIMKIALRNNIHNMPQGPPNPGFMPEKVQNGDFLKKTLRKLNLFCCFRFL